jgi:flagellar basal-body rod modification protein FlgD
MAVNAIQSNSGPQLPSSSQNELNGNSFITLLTAQLKAQDPLSPMDPTQFMSQLVQFNMLQQMIETKQLLQVALTPASGSANQPTTPLGIPGGN